MAPSSHKIRMLSYGRNEDENENENEDENEDEDENVNEDEGRRGRKGSIKTQQTLQNV